MEKNGCGGKHLRLTLAIVTIIAALLTASTVFGVWQRKDIDVGQEKLECRIRALETLSSKLEERLVSIQERLTEVRDIVKRAPR